MPEVLAYKTTERRGETFSSLPPKNGSFHRYQKLENAFSGSVCSMAGFQPCAIK